MTKNKRVILLERKRLTSLGIATLTLVSGGGGVSPVLNKVGGGGTYPLSWLGKGQGDIPVSWLGGGGQGYNPYPGGGDQKGTPCPVQGVPPFTQKGPGIRNQWPLGAPSLPLLTEIRKNISSRRTSYAGGKKSKRPTNWTSAISHCTKQPTGKHAVMPDWFQLNWIKFI